MTNDTVIFFRGLAADRPGVPAQQDQGWVSTDTGAAYIAQNTAGALSWQVLPGTGGGGGGGDYILIEDQKAQNTAGGTFTAGSWQTRALNIVLDDTGAHASLSTNQVTLDAGTYRLQASAPAYSVGRNRLRWQNISDAATALLGENNYTGNGTGGAALMAGRFTIATGKTFELQHRAEITVSTNGLGIESNWDTEVYAVLELVKE